MILENLSRLHNREKEIRDQSLGAAAQNAELMDHLAIIEHWMDKIFYFAVEVPTTDEDGLTVQRLGIRLFNTSACALNLLLAGYYQNAAGQMRDLLETGFLIDDFSIDRTRIKLWREGSEKERRQVFQPIEVRKRLDKRDGFTANGRAAAYSFLSEYGAHPTHKGVFLIYPDGLAGLGKCGPFFELKFLKAAIEELAKGLLDATIKFADHFSGIGTTGQSHKELLAKTNVWAQKYLKLQTPDLPIHKAKHWPGSLVLARRRLKMR
jgi:hypothetical protein